VKRERRTEMVHVSARLARWLVTLGWAKPAMTGKTKRTRKPKAPEVAA
jgi:hypothetical protein